MVKNDTDLRFNEMKNPDPTNLDHYALRLQCYTKFGNQTNHEVDNIPCKFSNSIHS